jgi:hypothetical protein
MSVSDPDWIKRADEEGGVALTKDPAIIFDHADVLAESTLRVFAFNNANITGPGNGGWAGASVAACRRMITNLSQRRDLFNKLTCYLRSARLVGFRAESFTLHSLLFERRAPIAASSARRDTPTLANTLPKCTLAVPRAMNISSAIRGFVSPSITNSTTRNSVGVRLAHRSPIGVARPPAALNSIVTAPSRRSLQSRCWLEGDGSRRYRDATRPTRDRCRGTPRSSEGQGSLHRLSSSGATC